MTDNRPWGLARFELGQPIQWDPPTDTVVTEQVPSVQRSSTQRGILRALIALLILALAYTANITQEVLLPVVLAAFLAMSLSPVVSMLARWMPRALATTLVMCCCLLALGTAVSLLIDPAAEWLRKTPQTMQSLAPKLKSFMKPIAAATDATESLVQIGTQRKPAPSAPVAATDVRISDALLQAPRLLVKLLSIMLLCFFFLLRGDDMLRRLVELSPTLRHKRNAVVIVRAIQSDTSRYLLTTTLINILLGVITAIGLHLLGLKDPLLWGAVAGLLNFIPYVGALVMVGLLALLGMLQFPNPGVALLPAAFFLVLTALEGQLISPTILGARLSLSPLAILLWLIFWGWMWGVAGVLLGVPLLMCLKIVCERFDASRWIARAIE